MLTKHDANNCKVQDCEKCFFDKITNKKYYYDYFANPKDLFCDFWKHKPQKFMQLCRMYPMMKPLEIRNMIVNHFISNTICDDKICIVCGSLKYLILFAKNKERACCNNPACFLLFYTQEEFAELQK